MMTSLELVEQFALALDEENYGMARECLTGDCCYEAPEGSLNGPDAIISSYQKNGEQAIERFEKIEYSHALRELDDGRIEITYSDDLWMLGEHHRYSCRQLLTVAPAGIRRIVHEEIPGEREGLNAFLETHE